MVKTSNVSVFGWNEKASRYIDLVTGRFVPRTLVMSDLEKVINVSSSNIENITQALRDGTTSIEQWQLAMEREIKAIHAASGALARGGWAQMSQSDWGFVGSQVKKQYQWLDKFARDLASGRMKLDGRAMTRAKLYAESGRGTYEEMRRRMMKNKGLTQERRVLGPVRTEHCETDGEHTGCVELAALGWQPIGKLPPIGESPCYTHCKCHFEFQ